MPNKYLTMKVFNEFVEKMNAKREADKKASAAVPFNAMANQGIDLSQWCGSVFDQGSEGSCTACCTRYNILWAENKYGYNPFVDPAVNAIYYYGRQIYGDLNTDGGSTVNDSYQGAVTYGVIPASDDPYGANTLYTAPPAAQDVAFKATGMQSLLVSTASIRASLDAGVPVGISMAVMQTLFSPVNGVVDVGTLCPNEGHAQFICAYKPDPKYTYLYKIQGSWGMGYGLSGYIWITEAYLNQCLWEVCTLDIPKVQPYPKPNVTHNYKITAAFASSTATDGAYDNITITTMDGTTPAAGQTVTNEIKRSGETFTPTSLTDSNGQATLKIVSSNDEDIVCTSTWVAPDGKTYNAICEAKWGKSTPVPPTPPAPTELWHVQVGAFGVKANADALAATLKAAGYPVFEVQYPSVAAMPITSTPYDRQIQAIVIHHMGDGLPPNVSILQRWNPDGYDYPEYDYGIESDGTIRDGRPLTVQGAHCLSDKPPYSQRGNQWWNRNSIGIGLAGDFSKYPMPRAQFDALVALVKRLMSEYGLTLDNVYPHGQVTYTDCPACVYDKVPELTGGWNYNDFEKGVSNVPVDNDPDVYLTVRVRTSKADALIAQIIALGFATKKLELA